MLSRKDNEYLTKVGPGTPVGNLFRRHWLPALLSTELPEPDCAPVRLKLLGEELVAFRATSGRVGMLGTYCPHRNANLFWGRNEEEGLRCVYHGWKFDADGACVDMPNEPPRSQFNEKIQQTAYATAERGGVIWVYMGPPDLEPKVPELEWTLVPAENRNPSKRIQACNWLQNLEGEVDSSHANFLHAQLGPDRRPIRNDARDEDLHPVFSVLETDYGLAIAARRDAGPDKYYWRITPFMLPSYTIIPGTYSDAYTFTGAVPRDDTTTIGITVTWSSQHPVPQRPFVEVDSDFVPLQNKSNDYLIDREAQRTVSYTGIRGVRVQDMAVQEDQRGPISDRSREHLGSSDTGVIGTRRRIMRQAQALARGAEPPQVHSPEVYRIRSMAVVADRHVAWQDLMREHMPVA
ncbi:MAG: Rieske 2Fe-2S domain-containing protein [Chloroflexi bacterium]|nr:Rieske 2Fe-2S domain-containing protein [Chloroflexota bacterium]MBV9133918.1 Rieske 2Fe-2S domain-containing protein [Chloroflexota bacterium]MBV9895721.1 Rieske 2Fe-2S domain-containing protein [Chloroflexota bacterium]